MAMTSVERFFRKPGVTDTALLAAILVAGAALRFWRLWDIPFTYDEFSAIFRTQFSSFGELIDKGVRVDTHPAGIQVLLFYLVKFFGSSEAVVKTPFIFFGLLSVWFTYRIGRDWFNSTAGLVAASFVSFLQFPVMYSQIARPYASGLCFCLAMVWFWTRVIFYPQRRSYLNLAGYVIAGSLCTYNHHFSMMFAAMVAVTGLFCCPRPALRNYLLAGMVIALLYLPHLQIFFTQLGMGGVEGWLHKPRYDFLFDFIQYIFQFSVFVYLLVIVVVSLGIYGYEEERPVKRKFMMIAAIWFLLPYFTGYFYSVYRNAVLQYSVLMFSFPFLLFLIFGFLNTTRSLHKLALVTLVALVVIPSLAGERQHYSLFYTSPYREMVAESKRRCDSLGNSNCAVILDAKKEILQYYLKKLECDSLTYANLQSIPPRGGLLAYLGHCRGNYLAFGCIASSRCETYRLILEQFPFLVEHKTYAGGDFFLFSRIKPKKPLDEYFYTLANTFEPSLPEWGYVNTSQCSDSLVLDGKKSFVALAGAEFSPTFEVPLRSLMHTGDDVIDASVDIRIPRVFPAGWLVVSVTSKDKLIYWNSTPVSDYIAPGQQGRLFHSIRLSDLDLRHHGIVLKVFFWSPMKLPYILDNFTVRLRSGNPLLYGIYRKVGSY